MVLCSRCATIDLALLVERICSEDVPQKNTRGLAVFAGRSFSNIDAAAAQGCELCSALRQVITRMYPFAEPPHDTRFYASLTAEWCHPVLAPVAAQCYGVTIFNPDDSLEWTLNIASEHQGSSFLPNKRASWDPTLWRSWMDDCMNKHATCNAVDQETYTPTRLIEVTESLPSPRLVKLEGERVDYVALSHCWGGSMPLRTTTATVDVHSEGISWDHLPTSFRDAVKVTRAIGCRYLWIDCLCIIQDSEEDWLLECALMGKVYTGAVVTIAADQSTSPSDGLFKVSSPPTYACSIPVKWPSTGASDNLILEATSRPCNAFSDFGTLGPLSRRGWALQERILSRRVLHVCESSVFFECPCSESTDRLPWPMALRTWPFQRDIQRVQDPSLLLKQWYGLIENYASRNLSNARDRLPAISGVARNIAERLGWTYIGGLWSHDLVPGLLWRTDQPDSSLSVNPSSHPGPSWSWASGDRRVSYYQTCFFQERHPVGWFDDRGSLSRLGVTAWASCLEVLNTSIELVSNDKYAEMRSARLMLRGKTVPIAMTSPTTSRLQQVAFSPGFSAAATYDPDVPQSPAAIASAYRIAWCLLAGFSKAPDGSPRCHALVVEPMPGSVATFRRVGLMSFPRWSAIVDASAWDQAVDYLLEAEPQRIDLV